VTETAAADGSLSVRVREANDHESRRVHHESRNGEASEREAFVGAIARTVRDDGSLAEIRDQERYLLAATLARFPASILEGLQTIGLTIKLVDHKQPPAGGYPGGRTTWWSVRDREDAGLCDHELAGYYDVRGKVIVLRQSDFRSGGSMAMVETVRHEMGHAIDDLCCPDVSGPRLLSQHDPRVRTMLEAYLRGVAVNPDLEWSKYATASKRVGEYFADAVMAFVSVGTIRSHFKRADLEMFDFIEGLLTGPRMWT
jgi:hypothetical protein